jgi:nucleoside-diphosphate-sugar epimerase
LKKNILITGASGFIGSHVLDDCLKNNFNVYAIFRNSKKNVSFSRKYKKKIFPIFYNNIYQIKNKLINCKIDYVIHCATYYIKKHVHNDIENIIKSNVLFSTILLDAVVNIKIKKFINLGTVWQHFNDTKNLAFNLYAASKQSFECIFNYYKNQYKKIKFYNVLLTDTFGVNDKRKKLVPILVKNYKNKDKNKINIPKNLTMNLVNVNEVTNCLNILLKNNFESNNYVIKSNQDVKIFDLINFLNDKLEKKIKIKWSRNSKNYKIVELKNLLRKENNNNNKEILKLFNENNKN